VSSHSLAVLVRRDHLVAIGVLVVCIDLVAGGVAAGIAVRRDDAENLAQLQVLATELDDHRAEGEAALGDLVDDELREQSSFEHELEVWRGSTRLGGLGQDRLGEWTEVEGCALRSGSGPLQRVCVLHAEPWQLVGARPVREILATLRPLSLALAAISLLSALVVGWWSSRVLDRRMAPLGRLEALVGDLGGGTGQRLPVSFGVREVDLLAASLNGLLQRVEGLIARERRFVGDAAHELRTPLARLRGQLERAEAAASVEGLDRAVATCVELTRTTEALLAMARDERAADETVDLAELAHAVRDALPAAAAARLRIEGDDSAPTRGDPVLLQLALANLVDNALKYTQGDVLLVLEQGDAAVLASVLDAGPGLAADDLDRVREPFVRGGAGRDVRGTGLGLALVDHVLRLHGGTLTLRLRDAGGLAACIRLQPWTPSV